MKYGMWKRLIIMLALCLLVVSCANKEKQKQAAYERGISYLKKGDDKAAVIEFKNAAQIAPKYARPVIN